MQRIYYPNGKKSRAYKGYVDANKEGTNWTTRYTDAELDTISVDDASFVSSGSFPPPAIACNTVRFRVLESKGNITDIIATMKAWNDTGGTHIMDWWRFTTSEWVQMDLSASGASIRTLTATVTGNPNAKVFLNNHHIHVRVRGGTTGPAMKLYFAVLGLEPKQARMALWTHVTGVRHMGRV